MKRWSKSSLQVIDLKREGCWFCCSIMVGGIANA